jgi:hypothetical protein
MTFKLGKVFRIRPSFIHTIKTLFTFPLQLHVEPPKRFSKSAHSWKWPSPIHTIVHSSFFAFNCMWNLLNHFQKMNILGERHSPIHTIVHFSLFTFNCMWNLLNHFQKVNMRFFGGRPTPLSFQKVLKLGILSKMCSLCCLKVCR